MKWIENLIELNKTGKTGKCPYCGSLETDHSARKVVDDMGYVVLWCNACKKGFNASRIQIQSHFKIDTPIPKGVSL